MAAALERALGPALAAAPGGGSEAPLPPLPVLVLGPAGSGRTSLLLRVALAGGADGPRALFLAPSAIPRLPGGPGGPGTDPRALQVSGAGGRGGGWRDGRGSLRGRRDRSFVGVAVVGVVAVGVASMPRPVVFVWAWSLTGVVLKGAWRGGRQCFGGVA